LNKAPDAFRTISEVADDLDLPQHVLRFWESRFPQIRPMKRGGGRRYYRPEDVDLLRGIRHLLYGEGYTIRGVQRILREQGLRTVQSVGQGRPVALPGPARDDATDAEDVGDEDAESGPGLLKFLPPRLSGALARDVSTSDEADAAGAEPSHEEDDRRNGGPLPGERTAGLSVAPNRMVPDTADRVARETAQPQTLSDPTVVSETAPHPVAASTGTSQDGPAGGLAAEDLDRLRLALHRLQECRQLLDQACDQAG